LAQSNCHGHLGQLQNQQTAIAPTTAEFTQQSITVAGANENKNKERMGQLKQNTGDRRKEARTKYHNTTKKYYFLTNTKRIPFLSA